ncbi:hypothetical protein CVIRNUC_003428 [Coccomyxa viridis]|uniref:Uncharacterized protein n=1 Tax=Coccomyxa viridis TaxID=1274662 RepID=A0AAV1I310_9CHLO|nr:hypothetical protein CVIRNUC_003428 [Coccomyxa viridis]
MQEVLVCNLPARSGGLSNVRLDALVKDAGIKRAPDNNFLRTKRDKCLALSMAGADEFMKNVKASEAFQLLGINRIKAAGRVGNSLTEVKHNLEDAQEQLLRAEPPVPCDADAAQAAELWHQALVSVQSRLTDIKRMHGRTLGLAQSGPDKQRLIAEMKANQYAIKTALTEVTEKLEQMQSTAEQLRSPGMAKQAADMNEVREAMGEEVRTIDDHIKEVQQSDVSSGAAEEGTSKDCHSVCADAQQALSRTRALLKAYTDLLPSVQDADRLVKMRGALEERAASMKEVMRTAKDTVDRVLNKLGALDGEVRGLNGIVESPTKLAKLFRSIDALMVQHDEAAADAAAAQKALKDAHSSMQSLQRDLGDLVRMTGEHVDASELGDNAEMIARLKRHISGSGGLSAALSSAQQTHADVVSQGNEIEGRLSAILQGLNASLDHSVPQHGGAQQSILHTIEQIEERMAALVKERDRMKTDMLQMTARFQSDMELRTKGLNDRLAAMQQDNERVLGRVHDVVKRMEANNQAMRSIAESIPNVDSQAITSIINEQVSLLEDLQDAEALLNHSAALQHKIAYEASTATIPTGLDQVPVSQQVPPELSPPSLEKVHNETIAALEERDALVDNLKASVSREKELQSQPAAPNLADEVTAIRREREATEQKIADQESLIRVQSDLISKLPQEVKALEDDDGAAKERLAAIEAGLWDRKNQKDAALEAIDSEKNLQDSVDRETLRKRTDDMIAENNDRLRKITTTLETIKSEIETNSDPSRRAALQDEQERTRREQELHRDFDKSLIAHKADIDIPMQSGLTQSGLTSGSPLTQFMPTSDASEPSTPQDTVEQQRAVLERYQEELAHQKQEIDRLTSQESVNTQLHDQYNALEQRASAVSQELIDLLAPFGGDANALRSLVADYAASSQKTRELTSENAQLREDLASTHRTMAEEYDKRILQLQQEVTEAQRREATAKVDTLETRRRADDIAQDLKLVQDSTGPLQGLPVLRFDEHHTISSLPQQAVQDIVKDYSFLRDDYGVVQGETRDRIVAILKSLNSGSSVLDPDALPTQEDESPEVLKLRLKVYQESVRVNMSKQVEAKKEEARLLALAYDASAEHDELVRKIRKIPAPDGSIQELGQQLILVDEFINTVSRGHAGEAPAKSGLDSITEAELKAFKEDLEVMRSVAMLMTRIGGKNLDDVQTAVSAFALQHQTADVQLAAVPDWQALQQETGNREMATVRATILDRLQAASKASEGASSFFARLRVGRAGLAPVEQMARDAREMVELALRHLSTQDHSVGLDRLDAEVDAAVRNLNVNRMALPEQGMSLDGMLGGASSFILLCESMSKSYQLLGSSVDTLVTAWYSLVAGKPVDPSMLFTKPPTTASPTIIGDGTPGSDVSVLTQATTHAPELLAAFLSLGLLTDHDFSGTETLTADIQAQAVHKLQQYGRCMDAQRRAWGDVEDGRDAIKVFYLGGILKRYNLQGLLTTKPQMSRERSDALVKSLWGPQTPAHTQVGGAAVDWKTVNPYDVRKLNTLLISLNRIVMDRMKDLGKVSTLRADNEVFKARFKALQAALDQKQDFAEKLFEITKQSIDRALGAEERLANDASTMDDMKLFLLGRSGNATFNDSRNVLKLIDPTLDWSGTVSDKTIEIESFRERSQVLGWFDTKKRQITHAVINSALQSMARCARFLTASSAFTEEDDMLEEIHEIRRKLKEHLDELNTGIYNDAFFAHVQDLQTINDTWYSAIKDEEATRNLRRFENQILRVLAARTSSEQSFRRATGSIMSEMLATARELKRLVSFDVKFRTYAAKIEGAIAAAIETYRGDDSVTGSDVGIEIRKGIESARSDFQQAEGNQSAEEATTSGGADIEGQREEPNTSETKTKSIDWIIQGIIGREKIPTEKFPRKKISDAGRRLEKLLEVVSIPDAVSLVTSAITKGGSKKDWKDWECEGTERILEKLTTTCTVLYKRVKGPEAAAATRKLLRAIEGIQATRDFLKKTVNSAQADAKERETELVQTELAGSQLTSLQGSLQGCLQALCIPSDTSLQRGGGNLIETVADSLRTLFENVDAVTSLLKPGSADPTPESVSTDDSPFDPDTYLQRIAGLPDDEAAQMVTKLKGLQDSLRMKMLADPSTAKPTEAGILNLVLQQAVSYIELKLACSQQVAGLKKQFKEQTQDIEAKCAEDVSRADDEKRNIQKAYVDAESSDVPISPSDILYAFRSVSKPLALPEVQPLMPETRIDTQGGPDVRSNGAPPVYDSVPLPPPLYAASVGSDKIPEETTDGPVNEIIAQAPPDAHATPLDFASAPSEQAPAPKHIEESSEVDAPPTTSQVDSSVLNPTTELNSTELGEPSTRLSSTQGSAGVFPDPVDSKTMDVQPISAPEDRPVFNMDASEEPTAAHQKPLEDLSSMVEQRPSQPSATSQNHLQDGRKLEVVSDKDLADLRAVDWSGLASSVGKLVRHKLSETGTVAPEMLPPSVTKMSGGAISQADWKRGLFSATLACYVMHAILMRTPEIIRMVSVTETDAEGKSDTFTQAILNHSDPSGAAELCRSFLDAVFVDVSAMRLPADRVTSVVSGFLSAIDRDTAIAKAQWLTLKEAVPAERRYVRVDDFFKFSCLLLRALTESQSDRSENQDDMYRDALYVIGQVVRTRSQALSEPLNSLNLDAYRHVTTLNLGELKESHSRSGRAGVLTYLKFRNDVPDNWNQRLYPSWNDERFGTECYMQFNNHPFAYYDRDTKDGNVMPMVDNPSIERWGLRSGDGRSVDINSYRYHYLLGPFTRVFGPADDAAKIAAESTDIKRCLLTGESIFLIGYGASGAGKTSTLICRSGSRMNCSGKDSGVLLNVLQDRDISSRFPMVSLTVCEFLAGEGDPGIADNRFKKIDNLRFVFRSGVYSFDPSNAASRYEGRWTPANSLDLAHDPTTSQPYNLSRIIAHAIDTDRLVKATTNNPNSSRSHVLVFIKLEPDLPDGPCLIVGDFAGVENEFVCDSLDTLMQIYNQRDSSGHRMYTPKDLQADRGQDRQGHCKVPGSMRGGAADDFVLYNDLTLDTQAVLKNQMALLQQPELLERLCGHPLDRALMSTVMSMLDDTVKALDAAYPVSVAKADVSRVLGAVGAEREEAMYMAGDTDARVKGLLPALQTALAIASTAALWNSKRDADNSPAIGRALTSLRNMYKPENAAVQSRKSEPQWRGKVTDAVELDMLAFEMHSSRPGSVLGVWGLDGMGFGGHPRTSPKTPATDGAISWLDRLATKFNTVFKVVRQAFPEKPAEVAEILLSSWLGVHFAEFLSRDDTLTSMRSVCACRTHEGVFINDSLGVIRDVIRDLVQHQQAKQGRLMMAPAFSDMCLPLYCNPLAESCFGSAEGQHNAAEAAEVILGRDRSRTRVMSMLLDVIGPRAAEKLRVAIFCILLMNRSENNDPMVPFIDAEDLRIELARIEKSNRNSIVKRMLTDGWVDMLSSYSQLSDPPTVDQGVIDAIKAWVRLLAPRLGQGLAQKMLSMADTSQARAIKLLTMLDRVNAIHPVGTLQFIDSLSKYNLTNAMCRFSCDSKITFARSLFERVLQSLETGQLGDFKSVMEDNLRMREYLRPPRDPVTAETYDAAAKSGWLGQQSAKSTASTSPAIMTAARAIIKPSPKRPMTTKRRLGGGVSSGFNPCTVDEFLMQWATAVSERIANGEEPVRGALYSDFLKSCEGRKRSRMNATHGFRSLDALIEPMQEDVRRGPPRRKSRRLR